MKKRIAIALLAAAMLMLTACRSSTEAVPSAPETEQTQKTQETQAAQVDTQAVYQSLEGSFQDSVSQRAMMSTWLADGGLGIRVNWASSAFQENEWNMTAVLTEDNRLEYTDGTLLEITWLESNEQDTKEISSNQKGYFTIEDGKLLWNGAADEFCRTCVFERAPEEAAPQYWEPEYAGVYRQTWSEEIGGTVVERQAFIVLNEDHTGHWIVQGVAALTWDESQLKTAVGQTCDIALTQENGTVNLLVYESQDENPTEYEKIEELPAEMEAMIAEDVASQRGELDYPGIYRRTWSEEIGGTVAERSSYIVLNEDHTGFWALQGISEITWDRNQLADPIGLNYDIALAQENGTVTLLVYEFQNDNPTVYEKIDRLPADIEEMLAES